MSVVMMLALAVMKLPWGGNLLNSSGFRLKVPKSQHSSCQREPCNKKFQQQLQLEQKQHQQQQLKLQQLQQRQTGQKRLQQQQCQQCNHGNDNPLMHVLQQKAVQIGEMNKKMDALLSLLYSLVSTKSFNNHAAVPVQAPQSSCVENMDDNEMTYESFVGNVNDIADE
ncbi:GH11771 [Drosophila grimshawi]|uniref:GH11771 n=1 Tax=Drosophila grimshawi TaxID=7222 RepID=B4K2C0_DROGR|nr:GH11771 [Drosophila grimshawi]